MSRRALGVVVIALLASSCGGGAPHPSVPSRAQLPPLLELVPDGASIVVYAKPDVLWASPATRDIVGALVVPGSLDDLATRTGVDARRVTEAVLAEYPGGILLLVRGPFVAAELVAESEVRMGVVESRSESPFVRRAGLFGADRRELVALDRDVMLIATDVEPLSELLGCVTRARRGGDASAACHPALPPSSLRASHRVAPLVLFAPHHLDVPPGLGASLLLAEERALAVDATPTVNAVSLDVDLRGEFPPGADANFRTLCESVSRSDLGAVLGLDAGLESLRITPASDGMRIHTQLPSDAVVRGLRTLFGDDLRAMLGGPTT